MATPVELSRRFSCGKKLPELLAPPILDTLRRRFGAEAVERQACMGSLFILWPFARVSHQQKASDLNSNQISLVLCLDFQLSRAVVTLTQRRRGALKVASSGNSNRVPHRTAVWHKLPLAAQAPAIQTSCLARAPDAQVPALLWLFVVLKEKVLACS